MGTDPDYEDGADDAGVTPGDDGASVSGPSSTPVSIAVDVVSFLCELAMLVILAVAGWSLGNGGLLAISMAVLYPTLALLIWAVWLAPRSGERLNDPARFVVQVVLFVATAIVAALAGYVVLGVVFAVIAIAAFAAAGRLER
jgi:hypothetical protein